MSDNQPGSAADGGRAKAAGRGATDDVIGATGQPTDLELIEQIGRGEIEHMDTFVARHRHPIQQFLHGRLTDYHLAEDLVQEVFLRVVRAARAGQYDQRSERMRGWILTIARNCLNDHHRKQSARIRMQDASLVDAGRAEHGSQADAVTSPLERVALHEQRARVVAMLEKLPEAQREVVRLKVMRGMTFVEIADQLNCPMPTVKSRMRYALLKLHEMLKDKGDSL